QADEITLTGNINGFTNTFAIAIQDEQSLSIIGNGNTIDAGNNSQIFRIVNGTIVLSDLTLQNGRAIGGDGITGGGGGLGAGGALYLEGGNVTVENITFNNNQAIGGNSPNGAGGGGGSGNGGNGGGSGGQLNDAFGTPGGGGQGGDTNGGGDRVDAQPKQLGGNGAFGTGGGGGGGGGGDTGLAPDGGRDGGTGGVGGFGGGGGGGGGGGRDDGEIGDEEHGNRGAGGQGGEFAGNGGGGGGEVQDGAQGGGGAGLGGAIFVNSGASLNLINTNFENNRAEGGTGAGNGEGRGGGIFVRNGATVSAVGTTYNANSASTGNEDFFGTIGNLPLPILEIIPLTNPSEPSNPTDAGIDGAFQVTLNQALPYTLDVKYNINPDSTATDGTDYTLVESIIIAAGETVAEIPVIVEYDTQFDPDESVIIELFEDDPKSYEIGTSDSATLIINDEKPEVSITAGTNPQEENQVVGAFNIALNEPAPTGGLAIQYTLAGLATSGDDYTATLNGEEIPSGSF
ncbi:MAG: Calx-beta domain-containing protein, partial [Planktothrix sp.]